ncbi:hypothetical protein Lalb_Chr05g0212371 [Lupinus albus]|uniref:DUF7792 domain-containing protein n=1 Tax=Lupinus albus TaxID=3870 RepID=A0A6A4QF54_LUPAL|nr:hypothetical protein Lalb_Chr05g0212371 [Lupinus albus]
MKPLTDKLASQLHQAARATSDLYDSPARRIIIDTHQVLNKALSLVLKCHAKCLFKRVFTIIPTNAFRKTSSLLENSTGDVSWLLRVSTPADDRADADIHLGLPPIAANVPILGLIWEQIAILCTGSPEDRSDAAASLVSIIRGNDRCGKLIMKEGGVGPLLKLIEEGTVEGQENGARAIGLLGCEHESPMKVQCVVAWAISEFAANDPNCQDSFTQHNIITLLVSHLAFETVQEHSKYAIVSNIPTSVHALVMPSSNNNSNNVKKGNYEDEGKLIIPNQMLNPFGNNAKARCQLHSVITSTIAVHNAATKLQYNSKANEANKNYQSSYSTKNNGNSKQGHHYQHSYSHSGFNMKGRELEDPETKASMKEMAARALWKLAKGNSQICRSITESKALNHLIP